MPGEKSQARTLGVIDPLLTQIALGFSDESMNQFAGHFLFPIQSTNGAISVLIEKFGKERFRTFNTEVGIKDEGKLLFVEGKETIMQELKFHELRGLVTFKEKIALNQDPQRVEAAKIRETKKVVNAVARFVEVQQADLGQDGSLYDSDLKKDCSGAGNKKWDDNTFDPTDDILLAKKLIRGKIGEEPNKLLIGYEVFYGIRRNEKLRAAWGDVRKKPMLTAEEIANIFDLEVLAVGKGLALGKSGKFVDIWGKNGMLVYSPNESMLSAGAPAYGICLRNTDEPVYTEEVGRGDTYIDVLQTYKSIRMEQSAGFLFTNCV